MGQSPTELTQHFNIINKLTKAALAGVAVALTGPIGVLAIGVYYLRKIYEQNAQQSAQLPAAKTDYQKGFNAMREAAK